MSDADKLREIAENIEAQEDLEDELTQLKLECEWLRGENQYLRQLLAILGIDEYGDSLSVADVMAIESAISALALN